MSFQNSDDEDKTIYKVVINDEEQYSIWPEYKENPLGWKDAGKVGIKAECLAYIEEVWTDMRPLSLRKKMEEAAQNPPPPAPSTSTNRESVVDRLCAGDHPVVLSLGPEPSVGLFKEKVDSGSLHVKFTNTEGGTELGLRLDQNACDFGEANFEQGTGRARVVGYLSLDYTKVRCLVDIDLTTLAGEGHLEKAEAAAIG
jgi:uncharacterized protein YbdZ (MbtH family)